MSGIDLLEPVSTGLEGPFGPAVEDDVCYCSCSLCPYGPGNVHSPESPRCIFQNSAFHKYKEDQTLTTHYASKGDREKREVEERRQSQFSLLLRESQLF
ncbi:hypothetical protein QJS04_geneDACA011517 [Acorus gramineus]|uniref:Uncharacterized protein n=1 Tax=Acorus gramineus TaxID=55184 RepID=A0AAV9ADU1_ACOGR|nr:hypothetical protein QJS04_geneDACA011517 [Acorus gramineus]